ncbi:probable folate-biopterin transporter 4 [Rosa chinensis]|uniref:probable folate-biopterin transporter 4 n=1 Tax=Rosa chinensis TaxID=74649 RepID=UPI000D095B72|nr:probable folate-biopterin transporter 4 [Rosa chinensis]
MIERLKRLRAAFGASFLWLVCLIYFTQGFRYFVWTAVSYQLKDRLKLSPSSSQIVFSIPFFPWSIKPLYGRLGSGESDFAAFVQNNGIPSADMTFCKGYPVYHAIPCMMTLYGWKIW